MKGAPGTTERATSRTMISPRARLVWRGERKRPVADRGLSEGERAHEVELFVDELLQSAHKLQQTPKELPGVPPPPPAPENGINDHHITGGP